MSALRIVVADDQEVVRAGFAALLDTQPDMTVVGTACDGAGAIAACRALRPDVVLMDVRMPAPDGIEATRRIVAEGGAPRILMLTTLTSTSTSTTRSPRVPAASCSRTSPPSGCSRRCA